MRFLAIILIFVGSLFLISCSQSKLPPVKDSETLHQDCVKLFQEFPIGLETNILAKPEQDEMDEEHWVLLKTYGEMGIQTKFDFSHRNISANYWTSSIQNLKPIAVHRSNFGIYVWIKMNTRPEVTDTGNWVAKGYFVPCSTDFGKVLSAYQHWNYNPFTETDFSGIYEVIIPAATE